MLFGERLDVANASVVPLNDTLKKPSLKERSEGLGSDYTTSSVSSGQNSTDTPSYGASKLLMSVPNPKRSVPVNFFNLSDEDSFSPFLDESVVTNLNDSHLSAHDSVDQGSAVIGSKSSKGRRPGTGTTTPEIFEFFNDSHNSSAHHFGTETNVNQTFEGTISTAELERSRGVIGSARKSKSSNSNNEGGWTPMKSPGVLEALGGDRNTELGATPHSQQSLHQLAPARPSSLSPAPAGSDLGAIGARSYAGSSQQQQQPAPSSDIWDSLRRPQAPICRPSSTPVYSSSISSLFGDSFSLDMSPPGLGGAAFHPDAQSTGKVAHDAVDSIAADLLSGFSLNGRGAGAVGGAGATGIAGMRGRDRDYSFGSLLGFAEGSAAAGYNNRHQFNSGGNANSNILHGTNNSDAVGDAGISGAADFSLLGRAPPHMRTMSAPPQFLISPSAYPPLELSGELASGARAVVGGSRTVSPVPAGLLPTTSYLNAGSRGHSPLPMPNTDPARARTPVLMPLSGLDDFHGAEGGPSSVEATVLRSCREILAGAAEHSLKAVELANTLRARVGTESLARVREQWGGLLSLLEKHSAHFRVDRIPKNDKVTLLQGGHGQDIGGAQHSFELSGPATSSRRAPNPAESASLNSHQTSNNAGASTAGAGGSYGAPSSAGATRCLHVGNVPANMTEVQLVREFEKFGQLDGLKLVSQRNGTRRFAFITFRTVEQAISARHCLSKVHPWKSAISFAHKEFSTAGVGSSAGPGGAGAGMNAPSGMHPNHYQAGAAAPMDGYGGPQQHQMQMNLNMLIHNQQQHQLGIPNSNLYQQGLPEYQNSMLYHMQNNQQMLMAQQQQQQQYPFMQYPLAGGMGMSGANPAMFWMQQQAFPSHLSSPVTAPLQPPLPFAHHPQHLQQQHQQQQAPPAFAGAQQLPPPAHSVDRDCPVLRRLCDDTYVPTQPWPMDPARDPVYCSAVVAQLQQFGGCTTISKLRGFLRNRVLAVDNIKSVPLKAMLTAYPQLFVLENNYVYLVNSDGSNNPAATH